MCVRVLVPALLALLASTSAQAAVEIDINKDTQTMTVAVDGVTKYTWPVSSGLPAYETPSGSYKAFRMEEDHFSKEWDDAPMPHSIFFTKRGHAIHGTDVVKRLGNPASHGCVRLSRENAATLFALVKQEGVLNTTVSLSGSSRVALARGTHRQNDVAVRSANRRGDPQMLDGNARALPPPQQISPREAEAYYYDQYGRPVPAQRAHRRGYETDSYYVEQPYVQRNPYPRAYGYGNPYYGPPRYYDRRDYYYGN